MKKKPRTSAKRSKRAVKPRRTVSAATRAEDDRLREELARANLRKFDLVLAKAIQPAR